MLGLFGTIDMAKRGMDASRQGIEIVGHNLSNVSNPAFSRQRLRLETSNTLQSPTGPTGTGAQVAGIEQLRSAILDTQITTERGIMGYLTEKQKSLQFGEIDLGQQIDRQASTPEAQTAALGVGGQFGLAEGLTDFFNALSALSASPNSTADRQVAALRGESLGNKFNSVMARLVKLQTDLNTSVDDQVTRASQLLRDIADVSVSVSASEQGGFGSANDLRDRRQEKVEQLATLFNVTTSTSANGKFNLTIGGLNLISDNSLSDTLTTVEDGDGNLQVQTEGGTSLDITSGSVLGVIEARDGEIQTLMDGIDTLAATLVEKINEIHTTGFALDGTTTGADFFTGTDAASIAMNDAFLLDPNLIQASADGAPGNNEIAKSMAELGATKLDDLGNLTFSENYNQAVATFGQSSANVGSQLLDQKAVTRMLEQQRDAVGGVSIDEEVTTMLIFQRAFQASARMITTVDEMIQTVLTLGNA